MICLEPTLPLCYTVECYGASDLVQNKWLFKPLTRLEVAWHFFGSIMRILTYKTRHWQLCKCTDSLLKMTFYKHNTFSSSPVDAILFLRLDKSIDSSVALVHTRISVFINRLKKAIYFVPGQMPHSTPLYSIFVESALNRSQSFTYIGFILLSNERSNSLSY